MYSVILLFHSFSCHQMLSFLFLRYYPLTAPDVMPPIIYFCNVRYKTNIGIIDMIKSANASPSSILFSPKEILGQRDIAHFLSLKQRQGHLEIIPYI